MKLVEDHHSQVLEHMRGTRIGDEERHLLWRGDEDLRRVLALPLAAGCGVSPVRVSIEMSRPISATGAFKFRAMSTASAFSGDT